MITRRPLEKVVNALRAYRCNPKPQQNGRGRTAQCPAHNDRKPSLSITEGEDGRALLKCFAGCKTEDVVAAIGLTMRDLMSDANYPVTNKGHAEKGFGDERDTRTQIDAAYRKAVEAVDSQEFQRLAVDHQNTVNSQELERFAKELGVSTESLQKLGVGRDGDSWTFPERDAAGQIIGISRRLDHGGKLMVPGSKRGLTMPWPMDADESTSDGKYILIVEGASDAAAGLHRGFFTIGRPSATDGLKFLIQLLTGRDVVIVGENDDGAGRQGAEKFAQGLSGVAKSVRIVYPPEGVKDLREWVISGCDCLKVVCAIDTTEVFTPLRLPTASFVALEGGLT